MWRPSLLVSLALLSVSVEAQAAGGFGEPGTIAVSAERLFDLSYTSQTEVAGSEKTTISTTAWSPSSSISPGPYNFPRLAADYFVMEDVSLGSGLVFGKSSSKSEVESSTATPAQEWTYTVFALSPRIGVVWMDAPRVNGLWLRAGLTAFSESTDSGPSLSGTGLNFEGYYVWSPTPWVAIPVGLAIDLGIGGARDAYQGQPRKDVRISNVGLTGGLTIYF